MNVGILQFEIFIPGAQSLKEKRHVVKSLKERSKLRFNLAIAEVDDHDLWQKSTLGAVTVGVDSKIVHQTMQSYLAFVRENRESELGDHQLEIL